MTRLLCMLAKWVDREFDIPLEVFGDDDELCDSRRRSQSLPLHARPWHLIERASSKSTMHSSLHENEGLLSSPVLADSLLQDASEESCVEARSERPVSCDGVSGAHERDTKAFLDGLEMEDVLRRDTRAAPAKLEAQ